MLELIDDPPDLAIWMKGRCWLGPSGVVGSQFLDRTLPCLSGDEHAIFEHRDLMVRGTCAGSELHEDATASDGTYGADKT